MAEKTKIRTYSELMQLRTYDERLRYLWCKCSIGDETFGHDRYLGQMFYHSGEWESIRDYVISRDLGCDLAIKELEIKDTIIIHHMNPLSPADIVNSTEFLLNPEYLITTSPNTHNMIHYGTADRIVSELVERRPGDTKLW